MIERHCRIAAAMARALATEPGVHVVNEVVLNQIIVRFGDNETGDLSTEAVITRVQSDGIIFAGGARWRGQWVMRLSVIGACVDEEQSTRSVEAIRSAWRVVQKR